MTPGHPAVQVTEEIEQVTQDQQQPNEESINPLGEWYMVRARFLCPICGLTRNTENQIKNTCKFTMKKKRMVDILGYTCRECSYQTINRDQLIECIDRTHTQKMKYLNVMLVI